ncbi:MAG: hypothetical protein QFF03_07010 [Pseudomonadota bacterium]|nr:hypothetical protein [Pseudomonadota bacterium]
MHNIDAMLIAETINLPTINRHASFVPADWNFGKPARDDYPARVAGYARHHGVTALCRLDLMTMRWDAGAALLPAAVARRDQGGAAAGYR